MEQGIATYIKGAIKNETRSQEVLYRYCFENLMKVCMRYHTSEADAAASFNKAMHKAFDKLKQYRQDGFFLAWVHKIVVNTCLNELRDQVRHSSGELKEAHAIELNAPPDTYSSISEKEILSHVQQLAGTTRLVFNLYVMENYSHAEIAKLLGISEGTSRWHLNQAREKLAYMNVKKHSENEQ